MYDREKECSALLLHLKKRKATTSTGMDDGILSSYFGHHQGGVFVDTKGNVYRTPTFSPTRRKRWTPRKRGRNARRKLRNVKPKSGKAVRKQIARPKDKKQHKKGHGSKGQTKSSTVPQVSTRMTRSANSKAPLYHMDNVRVTRSTSQKYTLDQNEKSEKSTSQQNKVIRVPRRVRHPKVSAYISDDDDDEDLVTNAETLGVEHGNVDGHAVPRAFESTDDEEEDLEILEQHYSNCTTEEDVQGLQPEEQIWTNVLYMYLTYIMPNMKGGGEPGPSIVSVMEGKQTYLK